MYDYQILKKQYGNRVSQTVDSPITIFDFWELGDAFAALFIVLVFGVLFYSWGIMFVLLVVTLGIGPVIKRKNKPGIFFHWPYRVLGIQLPGLFNPKGRRRFSD